MIIISDTTPLRYLIEVGCADILEALFGNVIIPQAVFNELQREKTPMKVKEWIKNHPDWLEVRQVTISNFTPKKKIGEGEREALALVLNLQATALLVDDLGAMIEASRLNITTIPTFAILERAAASKLIDLPQTLEAFRKTSFRLPPEEEIDAMLKRNLHRV